MSKDSHDLFYSNTAKGSGLTRSQAIAHDNINEFFERVFVGLKPNTKRALESDLKQYFKWCMDEDKPRFSSDFETSKDVLYDYLKYMQNKGYTSSTLKRRFSSISKVYKIMELRNPLQESENLIQSIKNHVAILPPAAQVEPVRHSDLKYLPEISPDSSLKDMRDAVIAYLGIYTLCRSANMRTLLVEDIDFRRETAKIYGEKNQKPGEFRHANLSTKTCNILKMYLEKAGISSGVIIRSVRKNDTIGKELTYEGYRKIVKRIGKLLLGDDAEHVSTHSFRVGSAVSMAEMDIPTGEISLAGGWKTPTMPIRYTMQTNVKKTGTAKFKD